MKFIRENKNFLITLAVVGFIVYAFNFANPLFWDDDEWIIGNRFIHDFSHLKEIFTQNILAGFGLNSNYYRPLLLLSFALNYILGGTSSWGYHLVSNVIHVANGLMVFLLALLIIPKRKIGAFIAGLIFLIHPVQVEAVAYISGRGDPLSVFFMLVALLLLIRARHLQKTPLYRGLSLTAFVLALGSRETAILFPALAGIALLAVFPFKSIKDGVLMLIRELWPYVLIAAGYFVLRMTILNFNNTLNFYSQENEYTRHLSFRLYTFGHVLIEYFRLLILPIGLHMERILPLHTSVFQWPVWLGALVVGALVSAGIWLYKKKPANLRIWLFAWNWFFIALLPVSGLIPINAFIYEHWLYLPLIGISILVGYFVDRLINFRKKTFLVPVAIIIVGYLVFFGVASARRNLEWGDPVKFYENILQYNPSSVRILNNLSNLYAGQGRYEEAAALLERIIADPEGRTFAQPFYNLGNIYRDKGDYTKALELYHQSLKIDPNFHFAYRNIADIAVRQRNVALAIYALESLIKLGQVDGQLYYNLGVFYAVQGDLTKGIEYLKKALDPTISTEEVRLAAQLMIEKIRTR